MQSNLNILHIEDDHADAQLVEAMLREGSGNTELSIKHIETFQDAINELSQNDKYNLILLDLTLGDISGIRNVEIINELCPRKPIIVLTGSEGEELAIKALRAGAQEFLVKAYGNSQALKYAIRSAIERKEYENELFRKANYDHLTNLPNFRFLTESLEIDIAKAKRWKNQIAFMFLDIHKFKSINDEHGHENGNLVIKVIANRIKDSLRNSDFIARYGGDEFAVILDIQNSDIKSGCSSVASKILDKMSSPILLNDKEVFASVNIGFSIFPDNGEEAKELLKAADSAMYSSKEVGANIYKFA